MKKYGPPLAVIAIGSAVLYFIRRYALFSHKQMVLSLLTAIVLFVFGCYLPGRTKRRKKEKDWLKKIIVTLVFVILVLIQLGLVKISFIQALTSVINANTIAFYMLYVYLGYIFF